MEDAIQFEACPEQLRIAVEKHLSEETDSHIIGCSFVEGVYRVYVELLTRFTIFRFTENHDVLPDGVSSTFVNAGEVRALYEHSKWFESEQPGFSW